MYLNSGQLYRMFSNLLRLKISFLHLSFYPSLRQVMVHLVEANSEGKKDKKDLILLMRGGVNEFTRCLRRAGLCVEVFLSENQRVVRWACTCDCHNSGMLGPLVPMAMSSFVGLSMMLLMLRVPCTCAAWMFVLSTRALCAPRASFTFSACFAYTRWALKL